MILVDNFYEILKKNKVNFFTGVPDSVLKLFLKKVSKLNKEEHVAVLIENKTFFEKQKKLNINNNNICISSKKISKKIYQVFKSYNKVYN
jgi:hypothetical protein